MDIRSRYGEWALVLGASEGLGETLARKLANFGASVVLVGRRENLLTAVADSIEKEYGVQTKVIVQDLSDDGAIERIYDETSELDMGFVTYVACLSSFGRFETIPEEFVLKQIQTNVIALTKATHKYYSLFRKKGRGAILNISSAAGINGVPCLVTYGATKAFITQMTKTLACECFDTGVDVKVSIHGSTSTPAFIRSMPAGEAGEYALRMAVTPQDAIDEVFARWDESECLVIGEDNRSVCEPYIPRPSKEEMKMQMQMYDRPPEMNN